MLSARCKGVDVLAWDVSKDDAPFSCPMCKANVLVKKGRVNTHHFAHIPPSSCAYGVGESDAHRQAKVEISEALRKHPNVSKLQLERSLGEVRPDISFCIDGHYVAIEVQISTLPIDTVIKRTQAYARKGIYLLWVSPLSEASLSEYDDRYAPRIWEKYLHALYFGRVYYWHSGEMVVPVRFKEHRLYVKSSTWYSPEGEECGAGGYHRYSKRYRTPLFQPMVSLSSFSPVKRAGWSNSSLPLPASLLWCEPYKKASISPQKDIIEDRREDTSLYCAGCYGFIAPQEARRSCEQCGDILCDRCHAPYCEKCRFAQYEMEENEHLC